MGKETRDNRALQIALFSFSALLIPLNAFSPLTTTVVNPRTRTNELSLFSQQSNGIDPILSDTTSPASNTNTNFMSTRRNVLTFLSGTAATTTILLLNPRTARADITSKLASSSSLRVVKKSLNELKDMELYVGTNDYANVKQALRVPPFTDLRKNCRTLVKGGEDGPESKALEDTYGAFIKDIEALDAAASMGVRGKKGVDMNESFNAAVKDLTSFYEVAERASTIPVQYAD
mmetsp:Transcript_20672/g.25578  ORF Transcript_20672/g.25578 Transcript_20672/m.25578 type:complete len:233 (-) Transcript_20672:41-739(-)|eukprot:CAMPEP_0172498052 /NCGR_PEP_ID=MMETSP1066-20121228/108787_1 /TAXON_ID=671091 /ORGANISM="Coscinodiscus wailesii, Strain CCMP2513" /LENGTH=232 /DNA_ID=CAMNT_0013271161 /DNA_START=59 /DNA_END=757 /DNA_ORIENTATION=+